MLETQYILTIEEAKEILGITGTEEDDAIKRMLADLTCQIEEYLGWVFVKRDVISKISIPYGLQFRFIVPLMPINSLTEITFKDCDFNEEVKELSNFNFDYYGMIESKLVLPTTLDGLKVSYNAGLYDSNSEIPAEYKNVASDLLELLYSIQYKNGGKVKSESLGDYSYTLQDLKTGNYPQNILNSLNYLKLRGI